MHTFKTTPKRLSIGPASQYLGISRDTLRRWEKRGKITPYRTPTNHRLYTQSQLDQVLKLKPQSPTSKSKQLLAIIIVTCFITFILGYFLLQLFTR